MGTVDRARRIYVLGLALGDLDETHREALDELYAALVHELSEAAPRAPATTTGSPDATAAVGSGSEDVVARRRERARAMAPDARTRTASTARRRAR